MVLHLAFALLAASFEATPAPSAVDGYAGRNGEAEALDDIARGNPVKVYYRSACGDRCIFMGVGLSNCEPERFDTQTAPKGFFINIPEASLDANEVLTGDQRTERMAAYSFAEAYNHTMFRERKREILRHCPRAVLDK